MSTQLDRIEASLQAHMERSQIFRETTNTRLDTMQAELTRNTEVTEEVRSAATAAKWFKRAVVWIGGLGAGAVGIWQAWGLFAGRGGIGPTP